MIPTKTSKISSKGQITLPKALLDKMGLEYGQNVLIDFVGNVIQIQNKQKVQASKIKKFKPVSLGKKETVYFSENHNDIYDN